MQDIIGDWYTASFDEENFLLKIRQNEGHLYYYPSLLSQANPPGEEEVTKDLSAPRLLLDSEEHKVVLVEAGSSIWKKKEIYYEFYPDRIEVYQKVYGQGTLERLFFFRGRLGDQEFASVPGFDIVKTGQVNFLGAELFHISQPLVIGVFNDTTYWGHGLSGGPLYYAFSNGLRGSWLGVCCVAKPGEYQFRGFEFNFKTSGVEQSMEPVLGTQAFSLVYDGRVSVKGEFTSPKLVILNGQDEADIGGQLNALLEANGTLRRKEKVYRWWQEPIFCGWHEQVYYGLRKSFSGSFETGASYTDECTQENYSNALRRLREHGLVPGTVIIDAYWQKMEGGELWEVDETKWPDLRGFVKECHQNGQRVLLWVVAWARQGLPAEECIKNAQGEPIAPDPTHPRFRTRVQEACHRLFGSDEGCYNVDGLKIDGTNVTPGGVGYHNYGNVWGFELLRAFLELVYKSAKEVKEDALISTFCAHQYFNDVSDMVRLGDLYTDMGDPVSTAERRRQIYTLAMPDNLIDTDGMVRWCVADHYQEMFLKQLQLGIPCLYTSGPLYRARGFQKILFSEFDEEDYRLIREVWAKHRQRLKKQGFSEATTEKGE